MWTPALGQSNSNATIKTRLLLIRKQPAGKASGCEGDEAKHESSTVSCSEERKAITCWTVLTWWNPAATRCHLKYWTWHSRVCSTRKILTCWNWIKYSAIRLLGVFEHWACQWDEKWHCWYLFMRQGQQKVCCQGKNFLIHTHIIGGWPSFGLDRVNFPPTRQYSALFWIQSENNVDNMPKFLLFLSST